MRKIGALMLLGLLVLFVGNANARWLSVDPVQADANTGQNFNRYWYANNNPYKFTDPDGRQAFAGWSEQQIHLTPTEAAQATSVMADFTPGVGDVKGVVEAVRDPTLGNIVGAGIGLVPVVGDAGKQLIRHGDEVADIVKGADNARGTIYVDSKGNAIVTPQGGKIEGSPDGRFVQAKGPDGKPTGVRIDGGHKPSTHPDPRAQQPHAHVPGVKNEDGTPWLPVKQKDN